MASNYPGSLDSLTNPAGTDTLSTGHASQHTNVNDAVEAIEGELGTDPSGASATVKARFEAIDTELGADPSGAAATVKARFEAIEADDWVTTARIANSQVTSAKIVDATITGSDIASGTVTSANIVNDTIVNADINSAAAIDKTKIAGTAVTIADSGTVTSAMIAADTIVNADIATAAGIVKTKISGTAVTLADSGTVTSTMIANDTIVDADINASAAIAGSKLADGAITPIKQSAGYTAKTALYTPTNDDRVIDCTSGTYTVTLPTAVSQTGRTFVIRNSGTGTITIGRTGAETVAGATSQTLAGKGFLEVVSDGSNWLVVRGQYAGDEALGRRLFTWNPAYSTNGGWQATYGDTGLRSISSWDAAGTVTGTALPAGWGPVSGQAGFYRLQRVNSRITATVQMLQATSTNPTPMPVPAGFTSGANSPQFLIPMIPGTGAQVSRTWQQSGGLGRGASTLFTANDYVYQTEFTWLTPDSWPASLPGSAVDVIPL